MNAAARKWVATPGAHGERQRNGCRPDAMRQGGLREAGIEFYSIKNRHGIPHRVSATGVISLAAVYGEPHPQRDRPKQWCQTMSTGDDHDTKRIGTGETACKGER